MYNSRIPTTYLVELKFKNFEKTKAVHYFKSQLWFKFDNRFVIMYKTYWNIFIPMYLSMANCKSTVVYVMKINNTMNFKVLSVMLVSRMLKHEFWLLKYTPPSTIHYTSCIHHIGNGLYTHCVTTRANFFLLVFA